MTSTDAVRSEVERFIKSNDPEVFCITGEWGVGKTYVWQTTLDRLRSKREVGLQRYSYVSLFGITSLDGVRTAIFENLEFLVPQASTGFDSALAGGNSLFKHGKQLVAMAGALPVVGGAIAKGQPLLFASVRNQIICIDDLERRGGVSVKDVLGLISYLREQRGCKVVLLRNRKQLAQDADAAKEFSDYFEKVIDTEVAFSPTPSEAASIAIEDDDNLSSLIREHCERLEVSNIRVIKKVERLIRVLDEPVIRNCGPQVARSIVQAMVLFGWRKFDAGANPPSIAYLKQSEFSRYLPDDEAQDENHDSPEHQRWDIILANYNWGSMDDLDTVLMDFVETSVPDIAAIEREAKAAEAGRNLTGQRDAFSASWRPFHDSFGDNEDEVCEKLINGIRENFAVVSKADLDALVSILVELGRSNEANALIDFAEGNGDDAFWLPDDPFNRKVANDRIRRISEQKASVLKPTFDFKKDLIETAQNSNRDKLALLAAVPVERYQSLFENASGVDLRNYVYAAFESRKISNPSEDEKKIASIAEEALRRIGQKSKLNEIRIRKYGVSLSNTSPQEE